MTETQIVTSPEKSVETTDTKLNINADRIIKQVEYYFGDINLPRDKFLQEELKQDNGWIPLHTMLKFNRLSQICNDSKVIGEALKGSSLMEVSEDNSKIRRSLEFPLPNNNLEYWQEIKQRTVYVKGFPDDISLDEIQNIFEPYGSIQNIIMRRTKTKVFKGSVLLTFPDKKTAMGFVENDNISKYKDTVLIKLMQEDYFANKQKLIKEKKAAEKKIKQAQKNNEEKQQTKRIVQTTFIKGVLLKVTGFPENTKHEHIKNFFHAYGDPAFVTMADDKVCIRFNSDSENYATKVWEQALKASKDNKPVYESESKKYFLEAETLEGEEEKEYWLEFHKSKVARVEQIDRNKSKFQRSKGKKRLVGKRVASQGEENKSEIIKKPKRIIYDENGDPIQTSNESDPITNKE